RRPLGEQGPVRLHGLLARRPDQCSYARGGAVSRHPPLWRLGRLPPGWPDRGDHSGDRRRARGLRPPVDPRGALHRLAGVGPTGPAVRGSRRLVGGRKTPCAVGTRRRRGPLSLEPPKGGMSTPEVQLFEALILVLLIADVSS